MLDNNNLDPEQKQDDIENDVAGGEATAHEPSPLSGTDAGQDGKSPHGSPDGPEINTAVVDLTGDEHFQKLEPTGTASTRAPLYSIFTKNQKRLIVILTAWGSFFSPLSSNTYFPALEVISRDLHVSSSTINLTITSYMIFQAIAPTFFGDLADMAGRRPAYGIGFIFYIAANIGLALQNSFAALFVLRAVQSSGCSGTIALGNGIVGDIATSAERGTYMSFVNAGAMIGPAVSPVLGGLLSQYLGWRSIFWFLAIFGAFYLCIFLVIFPETGRNVVGNGSIPPPRWDLSLLSYMQTKRHPPDTDSVPCQRRKLRFPNPLASIHILLEKDVAMFLAANSMVFTSFYCVGAAMPSQLEKIYGMNSLHTGLAYIPLGVGCCISALTTGRILDLNYRRVAKKSGFAVDRKRGDDLRKFPIEHARIQVALPMLYLGTLGVLCFGWALEAEAHLAVPLVITAVAGFALTSCFNCISTLLVDMYPMCPATASAANNLTRCLLGSVSTAVIVDIINAWGNGWAFTFMAGLAVVTSPMLWVEMYRGMKWREERRVRFEEKKKQVEKLDEERATSTSTSENEVELNDVDRRPDVTDAGSNTTK